MVSTRRILRRGEAGGIPLLPVLVIIAGVFACAIYANLPYGWSNTAALRYFPPFRAHVNGNMNDHLGAEYFNIAEALLAGEGFASPFGEQTGPTAWMPPIMPSILAGLLWLCGGNRELVMIIIVFVQVYVLIGTGVLVLALARTGRGVVASGVVAALFLLALIDDFRLSFQVTHDGWLVLLAIDLLIAGLCWMDPFRCWEWAALWGMFGGICALINPIAALAWGLFSLGMAMRRRAWSRFGVITLAAGLTLAPWTIRNLVVFGRLIPVKSNLVYELFQSQCLQSSGLLKVSTFASHPYNKNTRERHLYKQLGEMAFLDQKRQAFRSSVAADPLDFARRVWDRFLGVTLWYTPFHPQNSRAWMVWINRLIYPLPFLGGLFLLVSARWLPLRWPQWCVLGVYAIYLLPYIAVSYYVRYGMPLVGLKVLIVIWALERLLILAREPSAVAKQGRDTEMAQLQQA